MKIEQTTRKTQMKKWKQKTIGFVALLGVASGGVLNVAAETSPTTTGWLFTASEMSDGKQTGWSNALHFFDGKYYLTQECSTKTVQEWNKKHRGTERLTHKKAHNLSAVALYESDDGVLWRYLKNIVEFGPDDFRDCLTECGANPIWRLDDGTLVQNCQVEGWVREDGRIRYASEIYVSNDMLNWKRLDPSYNIENDPRWYEHSGRFVHPAVLREADGWYGLPTTTGVKPFPGMNSDYHYTGLVYSKDALKFEAIEPIPFGKKALPGITPAEICAWIKHGDTYYAATDHVGYDQSTRVLSSPNLKGPYHHRERNPVLTFTPWIRFCEAGEDWLACTYSPGLPGAGDVVTVLLQKMAFDPDGTLRLKWWPNNDVLKTEAIAVVMGKQADETGIRLAGRALDVERGFVVEGNYAVPEPMENIALGAAAKASHNPGHAANLTDGSMLRMWTGWGKAESSWIELDFGSVKRLESMHIQWACRFNENHGVELKVETALEPGQWRESPDARVWSLWNRAETPKIGKYLHNRYRNTDTITGIGAEARCVRVTVMSPWQQLIIQEVRAYSGNPFDTANCKAGVFLEYAEGNRMALDGGLFQVSQDGLADFGDVAGRAIYAGLRMDRDREFKGALPFRLVVKDETALFYLDDELMRIVAVPELSGRVGVVGDNVTNLRAWQAPEPLNQ
jgi:hypothetical protein